MLCGRRVVLHFIFGVIRALHGTVQAPSFWDASLQESCEGNETCMTELCLRKPYESRLEDCDLFSINKSRSHIVKSITGLYLKTTTYSSVVYCFFGHYTRCHGK